MLGKLKIEGITFSFDASKIQDGKNILAIASVGSTVLDLGFVPIRDLKNFYDFLNIEVFAPHGPATKEEIKKQVEMIEAEVLASI